MDSAFLESALMWTQSAEDCLFFGVCVSSRPHWTGCLCVCWGGGMLTVGENPFSTFIKAAFSIVTTTA